MTEPSNTDVLAAVQALAADLASVKADVGSAITEVASLRTELAQHRVETRHGFDQVRADIMQVRADIAGVKADTAYCERYVGDIQPHCRRISTTRMLTVLPRNAAQASCASEPAGPRTGGL